jgi:WD40 repeat protein
VLQHPHIVAIHDVGVHEGRHYFSMDYVEGQNLAQLVGQQPLPPAKAARYVELIAEAIHYAHEHGILHRDLKPSNVLIDSNDQPRVTDFGLAKWLDGESSLTMSGQVLGSPNFMPPEQAGVKRGKVGRASDVYALGGILYHLLTARAPFQAESLEQIISQVLNVVPLSPRLLNASIPRDLETITLKCLEKEPSRRYQTAKELADELGRVLRQEPIQARPVSAPEKLLRWCRREPALAGALVFAIAALLIGLAATSWQWRRAERNAVSERQERERAEAQVYVSDVNRVRQALAENNLRQARQLLDRHSPKNAGELDLRGWEWRYLWQRCQGDMESTLYKQATRVHHAVFLSDGTHVATFDDAAKASIWDITTKTEVAVLQDPLPHEMHIANSGQASFSIDGDLLATRSRGANGTPSIKVWKISTAHILAEFPCGRRLITALAFSPNKQQLAAFTFEGVRVWDISSKELRYDLPVAPSQGDLYSHGAVKFSPDGSLLAVGDGDGSVRLVNMASGMVSASFKASTVNGVFALAFSPNGCVLVAGAAYYDPLVTVWDVPNGTNVCVLQGHKGFIGSLAFSADGKTLASASGDATIKLWNTTTWKEEETLLGHADEVWSVSFSIDGKKLVSSGRDGAVHIWSVSKQRPSHESLSVSGVEPAWDCSPDSTTLAVAGRDGSISLWDAVSRQKKEALSALGTNNVAIFWSPAGEILAGSREPSEIKVWSLVSATLTKHSLNWEGPAVHWRFLPKSGMILTAAKSGPTNWTLNRWNVRTRSEDSRLTVNQEIHSLTVSPDEHWLVIGTSQGEVSLFNLETSQRESSFRAHLEIVECSALLPGSKYLVTAGTEESVLKVWDLATGKVVRRLPGHNLAIRRIVISPDGTRMATTSLGTEPIKIWNTKSWEEVANISGNGTALFVERFLPDGNTLAALDSNHNLHLWRAPSWAEIETAAKAQVNSK